jgi:hypothetical protein
MVSSFIVVSSALLALPFPLLVFTGIILAPAWLLARLCLLCSVLLHLLHTHLVVIRLDGLLGVRCELGLPFRVALLGLLYGIVLVVFDLCVAVGGVFMSVWS